MANEYEFDVALSFAGEDRESAEQMAVILKSYGLRVFYDQWYQDTLLGENLYDRLADVYSKKAHYCVMFLSRYYGEKLWTSHERKMAQARAFKERQAYILPIRLDSTEITGIPDTVGYLDLTTGDVTLADAAYLVVRKLGKKVESGDVDPIAYTKSALDKVLQLDEDNLCYYHGRLDFDKWAQHRDVLSNTIRTIATFGRVVVPELVSALTGTRNRFVKRNVLKILEMAGSKEATLSVCEAAKDPDAKVRNLAILALQKLRDERAIPTLQNALDDPDTFVRRNAVVAMKIFALESLAPTLMAVVRQERDYFIQAHAVEGLAAIGTESCINFVRGLLNHPVKHVREAAQKALSIDKK